MVKTDNAEVSKSSTSKISSTDGFMNNKASVTILFDPNYAGNANLPKSVSYSDARYNTNKGVACKIRYTDGDSAATRGYVQAKGSVIYSCRYSTGKGVKMTTGDATVSHYVYSK